MWDVQRASNGGRAPADLMEATAASSATSSTKGGGKKTPRQVLMGSVRMVERKVGVSLLHPHRRSASARSKKAKRTVPADDLVARLQHDLRSEREQILEPLLHRLDAIGRRLSAEEDVPPELIEDGLVLWEAYLARLHDLHVSQFRLAGPSEEHAERCAVPLIDIEGDPERGSYRIRAIRAMWNGYNYHVGGYRQLLGLILTGETQAELAWEGFEEDYASSCLPDHLPPTTIVAWTAALDRSEQEAPALREEVQRYREHTAAYEDAVPMGVAAA